VEEGRVAQLPTQGADYSKYNTDHLKIMLRPGILHRDEARFKALIRKELQKREQQSQQGVAAGELEEDLSRRGFLRGLGAAAGAAALGAASKAQAGQGQNLGNGFVLTTVDVFGGKFKAVLDTQSDIHYIPNRNESGGAIVRSMAPFIMIKNGQTNPAMNVGPAAQAALKKAGLLKGVEESVAKGKIDFAKKLQGKVDKHNKAVVQTKKDIGSRIADIGAGGKEYNVKTDAAWDAAKKKVAEGVSAKVR
jgi:hypothetical protein